MGDWAGNGPQPQTRSSCAKHDVGDSLGNEELESSDCTRERQGEVEGVEVRVPGSSPQLDWDLAVLVSGRTAQQLQPNMERHGDVTSREQARIWISRESASDYLGRWVW